MFKKIVLILICPFFILGCRSGDNDKLSITIDSSWRITIPESSDYLVEWAAGQLSKDLNSIMGCEIKIHKGDLSDNEKSIIIGSKSFESFESEAGKMHGPWEQFELYSQNGNIHVDGSDARGVVYGVFELAKKMGVSPWKWWADVTPEKRDKVKITLNYTPTVESPSVKYRGIFLNDEDWGLQPWAKKTFEPETGDIGPKTYEKIFQLLLRLKANTIWPAMHPCTKGFYKIPGNNEMAKKYHIVVGTSHCEPMLRNNVDEWKKKEYGDFNYFTNKKQVQKYWNDRVTQVCDAENIITLGMRGIHDGHMHGGKNIDEKVEMLHKIIDDQRNMLTSVKKKPVDSIAQTMILYKEVLDIYNRGLKVPEDVTIMWCDDNNGYIRRLSDTNEQKRRGGSGVYYHLSYWGKPHDYLWLSSTQPALVWYEMNRAYQNGADRIWIANVGDIKPCEYNMELFLDMAWDINSVDNTNIHKHMQEWALRDFNLESGKQIADIMQEYYRLNFIRRPEFMAWSIVEPRTAQQESEFNPFVNNELERRLESFKSLAIKVDKIRKKIPQNRHDAYFQLVEYPVKSAFEMNSKFLNAQKALYVDTDKEKKSCLQMSNDSYNEIKKLTDKYNTQISAGKWNKTMSMSPRGLNVFKEAEINGTPRFKKSISDSKQRIFIQANEFKNSCKSEGFSWKPVNSFGYSGNAITTFPLTNHKFSGKRPWVEYEFNTKEAGESEVQIRLLPTHVNDRNQVVTVEVDGKKIDDFKISTKGRSKQWKKNALRNHAIIKFKHTFKNKGKHKIKLSINQTGIVIDQLAVDFDMSQPFYVIPVK